MNIVIFTFLFIFIGSTHSFAQGRAQVIHERDEGAIKVLAAFCGPEPEMPEGYEADVDRLHVVKWPLCREDSGMASKWCNICEWRYKKLEN